jgi:hypothetical protein
MKNKSLHNMWMLVVLMLALLTNDIYAKNAVADIMQDVHVVLSVIGPQEDGVKYANLS